MLHIYIYREREREKLVQYYKIQFSVQYSIQFYKKILLQPLSVCLIICEM